MRKPLPTSTATFRDIINGGFLYIDKTNHLYQLTNIFEFKLDQDAQQAVGQLVDKAYAQKYAGRGKVITQIGVNFDSKVGQVSEWQVVASD